MIKTAHAEIAEAAEKGEKLFQTNLLELRIDRYRGEGRIRAMVTRVIRSGN